jgi:hypothetical protein
MLVALRRFNGPWIMSLNVQMSKDEGRHDQFCRSLRAWLEEGKRPALKHFCLHGRGLTSRGEEHIAEGLLACPELVSLTLAGLEPWGGTAFATVLKPGCAPGLESLSMQWAHGIGGDRNAIEIVATYLKTYPRPAFRTLEFLDVTTTFGVTTLGDALASGACLGLTKFRFKTAGTVFDQGLKILAAGVATGGCPRLRYLELFATEGVLTSLLEGFRAFGLRHLERLCLTGPIGDEGAIRLAQALKASPRPCPSLHTLSLSQTGMADAGCTAVAELTKDRCLWRVRDMALAEKLIRVKGTKALVSALEAGGGADLMRLDFTSNHLGDDANEHAVPRPPAGIGAVLGRDAVLQEKMLLAPFLSTSELHSLSQSATWLMPFRHQLGHIRVKAHDKEMVLAKLPQQRRLEEIEVCGTGESLLKVLVALRRCDGSGWSLSLYVQMPKGEGRDQFSRSLRAWMEEERRPVVEHFCLYGRGMTSRGEEHIAEGLLACPELKSLTLAGLEPWGGTAFAKVLSPEYAPGLESLRMQWARGVGDVPNAIEIVASYLKAYPRPALRTLEFLDVTTTRGIPALGDALASGACLGLIKFRFRFNIEGIVFDQGLKILAAGVAMGGCPSPPVPRALRHRRSIGVSSRGIPCVRTAPPRAPVSDRADRR